MSCVWQLQNKRKYDDDDDADDDDVSDFNLFVCNAMNVVRQLGGDRKILVNWS